MTRVILELDKWALSTGYIPVTKVDERGHRKGQMPLSEVATLLHDVFNWDASRRQVTMISRFEDSPFLAFGQNGTKWVAVKVIEPAEYYLVSVSGQAYPVRLPRLVAKVGNHSSTYLFWTEAGELTPKTRLYPLMIGNINKSGWVCIGTGNVRCKSPDEIDQYIRQVIEVPATGTYLEDKTQLDKLYRSLTRRWRTSIGRRHAITLERLWREEERG